MTINIIGKKENNKKLLKENYFLSGDYISKRKKSMSPQSAGIPVTKIFLPFLWVAMTLLNKRLDRFLSGP